MDLSANTPDPDSRDPHSSTGPSNGPAPDPPDPHDPHGSPVDPATLTSGPADAYDAHELEDEGPEPHLDAATEARVRALLAAAADPGPMPLGFAERIEAALVDEARLRVDPAPTRATDPDQAVLVPLIRQRQRPRPLLAIAAVAAAAAVVAVGASTLQLGQRPAATALLGTASSPVATPSVPSLTASAPGTQPSALPATPPTRAPSQTPNRAGNPNLHIQLSETTYDAASLPTLARELLTNPGPPIRELAAESPYLGPIATQIGLTSCLDALGIPTTEPVHADLAFYEGEPAVVIVTSSTDGDTAFVVKRSCTRGDAGVLLGATPVP